MERTFWQKLEGTTEQVLAQLMKLIEEGNIRRVVVKQKGKTIAEFPLTAGAIDGSLCIHVGFRVFWEGSRAGL